MKTVNLEQNTEEWLNFRKSKIGASDIPVIIGVSKWSTAFELWQRKLGFIPDIKDNPAMKRGRDLEPVVRDLANGEINAAFVPAVVVHEELDWASASLDGVDEALNAILEIKCPNSKDHQIAKDNEIPPHYYPQVQWQLFVSEMEKCFYVSYHQEEIVVVEVPRDDDYILSLLPDVTQFHRCLLEMEEPLKMEKDIIQIDDEEFGQYVGEWKEANKQLKVWQEKEKFYKNKLVDCTDDSDCAGFGITLKRIKRDGSVDWNSLWETIKEMYPEVSKTIIPDSFRKETIGYWKVTEDKK